MHGLEPAHEGTREVARASTEARALGAGGLDGAAAVTQTMISEPSFAEAGATLSPVAEGEHPAAKAGRFVRAAGRAGAAAAREFERQSAARPQPLPVEPPPPPPALRTAGLIGRAVFVGFVAGLVAFALAVLRVEAVLPDGSRLVVRLVLAAVLLLDAAVLTSNWAGANQRLGQRLLNRVWGTRGAVTRREKAFAHVVRDAITLIGIAFLGAAIYELIAAATG
jgi:hypothetical protein